jgi:hypothetical protein
MAKEFISLGLFLLLSAGVVFVLVPLWRMSGRAGRAVGVVLIGAAYVALTFVISQWASSGGWPEGMFVIMAAVFVAPVVVLIYLVALIIALFGGGEVRTWRRTALWISFLILALIIAALALNKQIRAAWYQRDLDNPDPHKRGYAVLMLGHTELRSMVPVIVERLGDEDPAVREDALLALCTIDDPKALPAVREALNDPDPGVREKAVTVIVPLGRGGPEVIDDLMRMLADPEARVRDAAVSGLDTIDPQWRERPDVPQAYR